MGDSWPLCHLSAVSPQLVVEGGIRQGPGQDNLGYPGLPVLSSALQGHAGVKMINPDTLSYLAAKWVLMHRECLHLETCFQDVSIVLCLDMLPECRAWVSLDHLVGVFLTPGEHV